MAGVVSTPDQRSTILAAAVDLLRTDGPTGLTVRNVAAAAGYSTTGVYTWFGNKQGLVDAIYMAGFDSFDAALAAVEPEPGAEPDPAWLVARGSAYRRWALDHPTEYLVMFARAVPEHTPSDEARLRGLASFAANVDSISRVKESGHLAGHDAETVAYHLWATVHGYTMLELTEMGAELCIEHYDPASFERLLTATIAGFA